MEHNQIIPRQVPAISWESGVRQIRTTDQPLAGIALIMDQAKARCDLAAPELFASFHVALNTRHASDVIEFADQFEAKVIQPMAYAKQDQLAEIAVRFLCANLADQHRISLSVFALRCPISKHVGMIFQCSMSREMEVLIGLHRAALTSAAFVRLGGPKASKPSSQLELVASSAKSGVVILDRVLILRLRWRILRRDSLDGTCWAPEFLQLCESDPVVFLRWETTAPNTDLARLSWLGITTNRGKLPHFLAELLREDSNPSEFLTAALAPLLSRIPPQFILVPERPNLDFLFRLDCLWCRPVMRHPRVIEHLRDPDVVVSQSLLRALPPEDEVEAIFREFPHGFAAMLANFDSLVGTRPRSLCDAQQILIGRSNIFRDAAPFAVVSVVFLVAKRGGDLVQFAGSMGTPDWAKYCLFFVICYGQYDQAIDLLNRYPFLFPILKDGVEEEMSFVGLRKWTDSRIRFAFYCARNEVEFEQRDEWKAFLNAVRVADWPDAITLDNQNLRVFDLYRKAID
jgi:hypothetical protein